MPSKHESVFAAIDQNFRQAAENYYRDQIAHPSAQERAAIRKNLKDAEDAYNKAAMLKLGSSGDALDAAFANLTAANKEIENARASAKKIDNFAALLKQATAFAGIIVKIAAL